MGIFRRTDEGADETAPKDKKPTRPPTSQQWHRGDPPPRGARVPPQAQAASPQPAAPDPTPGGFPPGYGPNGHGPGAPWSYGPSYPPGPYGAYPPGTTYSTGQYPVVQPASAPPTSVPPVSGVPTSGGAVCYLDPRTGEIHLPDGVNTVQFQDLTLVGRIIETIKVYFIALFGRGLILSWIVDVGLTANAFQLMVKPEPGNGSWTKWLLPTIAGIVLTLTVLWFEDALKGIGNKSNRSPGAWAYAGLAGFLFFINLCSDSAGFLKFILHDDTLAQRIVPWGAGLTNIQWLGWFFFLALSFFNGIATKVMVSRIRKKREENRLAD